MQDICHQQKVGFAVFVGFPIIGLRVNPKPEALNPCPRPRKAPSPKPFFEPPTLEANLLLTSPSFHKHPLGFRVWGPLGG